MNYQFAWHYMRDGERKGQLECIALHGNENGKAIMEKPKLLECHVEKDMSAFSFIISMTMDDAGAEQWAKITKKNTGRSIAMVYDERVLSYPSVNGEITGGKSSITGQFTQNEAQGIVSMLSTEPLVTRMVSR
jgi:SecD/SecF fusion protein